MSAPVSTEPFPAEEAADEVPVIVEADQMSDWDVYWDDYIRLPSASAKVSTHSSSETRSCEPQIASMFSSLADDGEHINRLELAVLLSASHMIREAY